MASDLRMLCQDLVDRVHASDPSAALEFAGGLMSWRISADTFVESYQESMVSQSARTDPIILIERPVRTTH